MHDYTTIIGVIELRLNKISYDNVQKRYRIGRSGISLIMERYRDSGLSLDDLKKSYSERIYSRVLGEYTIFKIFGDDIRIKKQISN